MLPQKLCHRRIMGNIRSDLQYRQAGWILLSFVAARVGDWGRNRGAEGGVAKLNTIARSPNFQSRLDNIISLLFGTTIFSGKTTSCPKYHIQTVSGEKLNEIPFNFRYHSIDLLMLDKLNETQCGGVFLLIFF